MPQTERIHATSVTFCGHGLLIRGDSASGKSDLALRLLDAGGALISDDQTLIELRGDRLIASAPESIRGLIEIRGHGIVRMACAQDAQIHAVIQCETGKIERMPPPASYDIHGILLPLYLIHPFEASAVAKIRAILQNPVIP